MTSNPQHMCLDFKMTEHTPSGTTTGARSRIPFDAQTESKYHTSSTKTACEIRRKASFVRRLGFSKSVPSSDDSLLINSGYFSPFANENSGHINEQNIDSVAQLPPFSPDELLPGNRDSDESNDDHLSIGKTPILYGHGTQLTTILEQKSSAATMRTSTSTTSLTSSMAHPYSVLTFSSSTASGAPRSRFPSSSPLKAQFSASGILQQFESFSTNDDSIELSRPPGYEPDYAHGQERSRASSHSDSPQRQNNQVGEFDARPLLSVQPSFHWPLTPPGMHSCTSAQQSRPHPFWHKTAVFWDNGIDVSHHVGRAAEAKCKLGQGVRCTPSTIDDSIATNDPSVQHREVTLPSGTCSHYQSSRKFWSTVKMPQRCVLRKMPAHGLSRRRSRACQRSANPPTLVSQASGTSCWKCRLRELLVKGD